MEISHPWHNHPLFLNDEVKLGAHCSICEKELDADPFYTCVDCKYYVHKSCAQLPVEIQHQFHAPHPLALCFGYSFICDSCHKSFENEVRFSCSKCNFDLDVKCATMSDIDKEGKEFIQHFTHQHPLTICSKDGDYPFTCFACKKTSSDLIYGCSPCDYFLHKSCYELCSHVLHAMHPQHVLSLAVKFGCCTFCKLYDHTWKYCCTLCDFYLDVSCLIKSVKLAQNLETPCFLCGKQHLNSESCIDLLYLIDQSCIQLPEKIEHEFHFHKPLLLLGAQDFECDSCHKWFDEKSHYGCEECNFRMDTKCALMLSIQYEERDKGILPVIPPHFSHQHPLQLIREVYGINCSVCYTTKVSPIYGCFKCEYFLHESCLELPIHINHPLHDDHVLTLQPLRDSFCQICCKKYVGFAFGCAQCLFFIGIECIFELGQKKIVLHKYHYHLLYLIENSYCDRCNSDNTFCRFFEETSEFKLTKSYSLRCIECDYNLHFLCGPLPCTIKHKSHLHVLVLEDSIVEDDTDEHYCDICEEIRNPRLCVYYCEDCQFFAHVHCVISEIINVFKTYQEKYELRIVGDLRFEDTIDSSCNILTGDLLLDLLNRLDSTDLLRLGFYFPEVELFQREEEETTLEMLEDDTWNVIEELYFYNDAIYMNIEKRLGLFKPSTKYHIQPDEYQLPVVEVEGYKVTSNFVSLFRTLRMKYGDIGKNCVLSDNVKSILLYFLCRVLRSMCTTFIVDITEKQLLTWLYYTRCLRICGFDLKFFSTFLRGITKSYFGLRAMKFESEAPDKLDQEILDLEQKISDIEVQIEELKCHRQQYKPGKIAAKSAVMREFFSEAKERKWQLASKGMF